MEFTYTKKIEISVVFEAPLLGYDVKKAYLPKIEEAMKKSIVENFEEGIHLQEIGSWKLTSKIENDFGSTKLRKLPKK